MIDDAISDDRSVAGIEIHPAAIAGCVRGESAVLYHQTVGAIIGIKTAAAAGFAIGNSAMVDSNIHRIQVDCPAV